MKWTRSVNKVRQSVLELDQAGTCESGVRIVLPLATRLTSDRSSAELCIDDSFVTRSRVSLGEFLRGMASAIVRESYGAIRPSTRFTDPDRSPSGLGVTGCVA